MQIALKSNEWRRIWACKTFKIEIQKGGPNISDFLQNWFQQEIRSPRFNFKKFQDSEKSTPESWTLHWNLTNDQQFWLHKTFKIQLQKRGPNNSDFLQNWFPPEIRYTLFNL